MYEKLIHLHTWEGAPTPRCTRGFVLLGAKPVAVSSYFDRRLPPPDREALLASIVEASKHQAESDVPVLVFDLDGTLLDNRPRGARIFHEMADAWRPARPALAARLATAQADAIVYGLHENLRLLGVDDDALLEEGFTFWKDRFFTDAYMKYDVAVPGARDFVSACYGAGATIVYLTGRDLPNMALGTFASLRDQGFPIGVVGTSLVTKPAFDIPDTVFKQDVAPSLSRHGRVVGIFDNEPANCNLLLEHHDHAFCVFLDTHHAPNPPALDARARVIDSFERE